jgi:hypothetical protein
VVRDGKRVSVDADQVVPGDVVFIKSGDKVPADLRLLQVTNLQVGSDISSLAGCQWQVQTLYNKSCVCRCNSAHLVLAGCY